MRPLMLMPALALAGCTVLFGNPRMVAQTRADGGTGGGGGDVDGAMVVDGGNDGGDGRDGGRTRDSGGANDLTPVVQWLAMSPGTGEGLQAVWRCDASTLVAVGTNGTLLTFAAGAWTSTQVGPETLRSVGGADCSSLVLAGDAGAIYGGAASGTFTRQTSGVTGALRAVATVGSTVQVAGDGGLVLRLSSNQWTPVVTSTSSNLNGLFGSSQLGWYAVGDGGVVLAGGMPAWQSLASGVATPLRAVFAGGKLLYAAGDLGTVVRVNTNNNGMGFTRLTTPTTAALHGVWASGMSDVWVVGDGGIILHSVDGGASWSFEVSGTTAALRAIWGSSTTDLWIVGDEGTVLHRP